MPTALWHRVSTSGIRLSNPLDTKNCRIEWLKAQATLIRDSLLAAIGRS